MTTSNSAGHVASIIARVEALSEQRKELGSEISDIWREAKSAGHDVAALKLVVRRRTMNKAEREALDSAVEAIEAALGDLRDTPLGGAALKVAS